MANTRRRKSLWAAFGGVSVLLAVGPVASAQNHGTGLALGPSGVAVVGEVATPGLQPVPAGLTLKGALAAAGGLNADADLHHLRLRRLGADQFADVDGAKALAGDPIADAPLQAGDTVIVPRNGAGLYFAVLGEVAQPVIDLCPTPPVSAKSVVDGALTPNSDRDHILIVQGLLTDPATARTVTVKDADLGGITLGPGDVVLIGRRSGGSSGLGDLVKKALGVVATHFFAAQRPLVMGAGTANAQERIAVAGEAFGPRLYFYGPGMTVKDVLEEASGLTPRADAAHLVLRRTADGDALIPIDATKALTGDPDQNKALQPGDTLYIPRLARADVYAVFGAVKTPTVAALTSSPPTLRVVLDAAALDGADKTQIVVVHGLLSDPATSHVEAITYDQAAARTIAAGDLLLPSRQKSGWADQVTQVIARLQGKVAQYLNLINNPSLLPVLNKGGSAPTTP